jgi:glycosyltransferase involved in cell wall biosynthesis
MHVTVLMGVYNEAGRVGRAIESVCAQTCDDWDLLAIDDASTDDTPRVLDQWRRRDERVHVLRNDSNLGLAATLNRGWRQARGELIARLDADDISLPDRLERQVRFLSENPGVAVLGTAAELIDERGTSLGCARRPSDHEELASRIFREVPLIHPSVMLRRSFYEALGGYDERLRRGQDYDLWLRGYKQYRFHNLPEPLIRYRVRRRPSLQSVFWGTSTQIRALKREGAPLVRYWYPARFCTAMLLSWAGLWNTRLR